MFETIIQGQGSERAGRKSTVLVSFAIHVLVLGILVVIPLLYYQTIPGGWEVIANVIGEPPNLAPPAPPQPASPAPPGPRISGNRPVLIRVPDLVEPSNVPPPPDIEEIDGSLSDIDPGPGPCCHTGPVIPNGILTGTHLSNALTPTVIRTPPPPPPKPAKRPVLVSILDPSRLIYRVEPVYPPLAIASRVQGTVMLHIEVNEMGVVESVEVVSGHTLLIKAAVQAVKQWRYKPTILNGEPVPVSATVTVNFNLSR